MGSQVEADLFLWSKIEIIIKILLNNMNIKNIIFNVNGQNNQ